MDQEYWCNIYDGYFVAHKEKYDAIRSADYSKLKARKKLVLSYEEGEGLPPDPTYEKCKELNL